MTSKKRLLIRAAALLILGVGSIPVAYACDGDGCAMVIINGTRLQNMEVIAEAADRLGGATRIDPDCCSTSIRREQP